MGVNFKVTTNLVKLHQKISKPAFQRGRMAMANQIGMDSNRFVPKGPPDAGRMRQSQLIASDASSISWITPYAHRQFTAPAGWRYTTPGTGPHWTDAAKVRYMGSWTKAFKKGAGL
jgi:hypothetical protein